jgi:hypothetical protein
LRDPRLGDDFHVLQAGRLRYLVVKACHSLDWPGGLDVNTEISDLPVEVGRINIIFLIQTVRPVTMAGVFVRR